MYPRSGQEPGIRSERDYNLVKPQFLPLLLSLASAWKPMKSQWKLLLYGKEMVRSHQDHCTKMTV